MYQDEVSGSLIEIVDKIIERIGNNKKGKGHSRIDIKSKVGDNE